MKRLIIVLCALALLGQTATAQVKMNSRQKQARNRTNTEVIKLNSTASFNAKADSVGLQRFSISDPMIRALNERAKGNDVSISPSGVVGMPKRAYGFASGRIMFRSTAATSSGTSTGTPSVGTGASLSAIGSTGRFIGMNGKNPYGGSSMWGNSRGLINPYLSKMD